MSGSIERSELESEVRKLVMLVSLVFYKNQLKVICEFIQHPRNHASFNWQPISKNAIST